MYQTRVAILATFVALADALPGPIEARAKTTSTITGYAHPLSLSPLETLEASATSLSYASPPKPITVTPAAAATVAARADSVSGTTPTATTTTTTSTGAFCTSIGGNYEPTTIPAFCNPSLLSNAPSLAASSGLAVATMTVTAVTNKIDCCATCGKIYNCAAWKYVPVYTGKPSPKAPGGFDPWGHGNCEIVYHTGAADASGVTTNGTASVCPNGKITDGILANGTSNVPGPKGETERWMNLYYNGWNEGACGSARDVFTEGSNPGTGDADMLCSS
ncbi:hypothetical protein F5Y15DRAFT_417028 [Xylariaceae sp. FL0016]|nr:hypothetical protein F5Y15DRAFT_417028 [Xylariaceae sp. FL0016]